MDKVYVLTIDDTNESWSTLETLVFSTKEKAKEHLEKMKAYFLANENIDEEESIIEDEEMSWTWYYDGDYNSNHYQIWIEEKEIL